LDPRHGSSSPYSSSITIVTAITKICPYPPPNPLYAQGENKLVRVETDKERVPQKVVIAVMVYPRKRDSDWVFTPMLKGWVGSSVWVCRALLTEASLHPQVSTLNRRTVLRYGKHVERSPPRLVYNHRESSVVEKERRGRE
jgi:hypothetical protein